jgi:B-box zinc finger
LQYARHPQAAPSRELTDMALSLIKCSQCAATIFPDNVSGDVFTPCPSCHSLLAVEILPSILKLPVAAVAQPTLTPGESSCFYHPEKKATVVCESCGRFLCGLCDLEISGRHLCPGCLDTGQKKSKFKDLENTRVRWDYLALTVAILPILFVWTSIIGAPVALYLVLRYRKAPCSLTGKSNLMFVLAAVLALAEIGGWALVLILILTKK